MTAKHSFYPAFQLFLRP